MARIKHQETVINSDKVPEWHPSAPRRPGKYVIKATAYGKVNLSVFAHVFAAKKMVEALLGDAEFTWIDDDTIRGDDITIHSDLLEEIMEYEYKGAEKPWVLPMPYSGYVRALRGGSYIEHTKSPSETNEKSQGSPTARPARAERKHTPRASRDGLVTAQALATELKIKPRELRGVLRKLKLIKPSVGWAWSADEATQIKAQVAKELK